MTPARFRTTLALATLLGLGYLSFDYASSRLAPSFGISGTVRRAGRPMTRGVVRFVALDPAERWACEGVVENGRYEIPEGFGLSPVRYQVEIHDLVTGEKLSARYGVNSELRVDLRSGAVIEADFNVM